MIPLAEAHSLSQADLVARLRLLPPEELQRMAAEALALRDNLKRERQLLFYKPVNDDARRVHLSTAQEVFIRGGNRSSKTETMLAELAIQLTGWVPYGLEGDYPKEKLRSPIRARLICASLTNTWDVVLKQKLQYDKWSGRDPRGSDNGHWGWIPKEFLFKGRWEESWTEKNRTLTLTNGSTLQIMSYDQELSDFSGASLHLVCCDEGPPQSIYRENKMRLIDVQGRAMIAFTPPDDERTAWNVSWIASAMKRGAPSPAKDPNIDSFQLFTERNRTLSMDDIHSITKDLTPLQRLVRLKGEFIHLSGRIYPEFTAEPMQWCFNCNEIALVEKTVCAKCHSTDTVEYVNFVEPFEKAYTWPCVYLLDPHPKKDVMMSWVAIDPFDQWWQIHEETVDGDPAEIRDKVFSFERDRKLQVLKRFIDPNMAESPAHSAGQRHVSVRQEYDRVGLRCDLPDDSFTVGKNRLRQRIRPDRVTRKPGLLVFSHCHKTRYQFENYVWDHWARESETKDEKQAPITKNDDFPTLLKYLANENPTHIGLHAGIAPHRATRVQRKGAY
jgi:phage terminase large subunit-like protein